MKAHNYVKYSLLRYSYTSRLSVLEHAFCVNGNGMEWQNGQLVTWGLNEVTDEYVERMGTKIIPYLVESDRRKKRQNIKDDLEQKAESLLKDTPVGRAREMSGEMDNIRRKFLKKNIDEIAANIHFDLNQTMPRLKASYYVENPSEGYVLLFKIPKDVQKDWGEAAIEFARAWIYFFMQKYQGFKHHQESQAEFVKNAQTWSEKKKADFLFVEKLKVLTNEIQTNIGVYITEFTDESEVIAAIKNP